MIFYWESFVPALCECGVNSIITINIFVPNYSLEDTQELYKTSLHLLLDNCYVYVLRYFFPYKP